MSPRHAVLAFVLLAATRADVHTSGCDYFQQAALLSCTAPLVDFVAPSTLLMHPPLGSPETLCRRFADFNSCVDGIDRRCRDDVSAHVADFYALVCSGELAANISRERQCFLGMSADVVVQECHLNSTKEYNAHMAASNGTVEQCPVLQGYLNCLVEHDYLDNCPEAVDMEKIILESISTNCSLEIVRPEPDYGKPTCADNGVCECSDGLLYNGKLGLCEDIDECAETPPRCSQKCKNTLGEFKCHCDERYYSLKDNTKCERNQDEPIWLLFAHGQSIWNISQDGKDFQLLRAGLQKTAMLDLDVEDEKIYYADIGSNQLERMDFDAAFPETIQNYEVESLEGIAVDWVAKNLYTLRKADIYVERLDGTLRKTLYEGVMVLPRALVVHPKYGYLYATDWSSEAFIGKATMDGRSFVRLIKNGVVWPNGLTLDYYSDTLYWADAFLDTIECSDLNGGNRRTVVGEAGSVPHVFAMAIADDWLYWTDWTYRGILRADKHTGDNVTVLAQTALLPYGLKIFHSAMQPQYENPCESDNGGCSQLCLIGASSAENDAAATAAECACADGFRLAADGRTCDAHCSDTQIECGGNDPRRVLCRRRRAETAACRCISKVYWCDGLPQCRDRADEKLCAPRICLSGQFQCHDNKKCLQSTNVCDEISHCEDNSDEKFC